jgi:hypothetical protein
MIAYSVVLIDLSLDSRGRSGGALRQHDARARVRSTGRPDEFAGVADACRRRTGREYGGVMANGRAARVAAAVGSVLLVAVTVSACAEIYL